MKREPIILEGTKISRVRASWLLFKESWRFLRADKEIFWIPIITGLLNIIFFGLVCVAFVAGVIGFSISEGNRYAPYVFLFGVYLASAFTLALSQASITHIVFRRLHGENATLSEGLGVAFAHVLPLLVWSALASTVGVVLNAIVERSQLLGRIVAVFLGAAWSVLTYFAVPAMVLDNKGAFAAIRHSGTVFRKTWGEMLVSNVSLGLVFFVAHIVVITAMIGVAIFGIAAESIVITILALVLLVAWVFFSTLVHMSLEAILKTLLYVYASERSVPTNFNRELLEQMLRRIPAASQQQSSPTGTASV